MSNRFLPFCFVAVSIGVGASCSPDSGDGNGNGGEGGSSPTGVDQGGSSSQAGSSQAGASQGGSSQGGSSQGGSSQAGASQGGAPSVDVGEPHSMEVCRDSVVASPGGTWLAFRICAGSETDGTWLLEVATGERQLVSSHSANELLFTPDESRLIMRTQDQLVVANTAGTPTTTTLGEPGSSSWVMVTPDSSTVIWDVGRKQIYAQAADGSGEARLLHGGEENAPTLSQYPEGHLLTPDAERLVFGEEGSMAFQHIVPIDGSGPSELLSEFEMQLYPGSLTNTRVLALVRSDSDLKVEDIELATGARTTISDTPLSSVRADATGLHFGVGQEIHRWQRGEDAAVKLSDAGGQTFFATPDSQTLFWYGLSTLHAMPADGSSGVIDVLDHGGVVGSFYGFGANSNELVVLTATGDNVHGIQLADLTSAGSGQFVESAGATKIGATVDYNGTYTHVLYFTRELGSEVNILRAAPVSSREPLTVAEGVWAWGRIPASARVYYYTDVDEITDVIATLHVVAP